MTRSAGRYDASKRLAVAVVVCLTAGALLRFGPGWRGRVEQLPARLTDAAFWQLVTDLSEPGGSFVSDNFVSNESRFQRVVPELMRTVPRGGVYLGVGPDQNFTYIVAVEPRIAFVVDIRRQNMLLHLMYKALVELSNTRTEFLSRLLSRPPPESGMRISTIRELVDWFERAAPDEALLKRNAQEVIDSLVERHRFTLSAGDAAAIERIQRAFYEAGPELRYSYPHRWFPSFADLVLETDDRGEFHSYLSTEEKFRRLKLLEASNLIVPVVGDFAGRKAIRAIGRHVKAHAATVSVFYTSNVEFYLFERGGWNDFLGNVAALPLDPGSVFIRAYFDNGSRQGSRSMTELDPIARVLAAYHEGSIRSYADVIRVSDRVSGH